MRRRSRGVAITTLMIALGGFIVGEPAVGARPSVDAAVRGILLEPINLAPRNVDISAPVSLPRSAPAYAIEPARTSDLRALAERLAGGPVTEARGPGFSEDLTSFSTGDGWVYAVAEYLDRDTWHAEHWTWTDAEWRAKLQAQREPDLEGPCAAERSVRAERATAEFFERVGVQVRLDPPTDVCFGDNMMVELTVLVDGLPLIGLGAGAIVDSSGAVVEARGPLWRLTSLGAVELAPPEAVLSRLVRGPGLVAGDCFPDCSLSTEGATLGLAIATTGGEGSHDHHPGGIVERPPTQLLVPALRVPATNDDPRATHQGVLAVSSALLVDDPDQADAARQADASSSGPPPADLACTGNDQGPNPALAVCVSASRSRVGVPVLLTVSGERYEPVGASGCRPLFTLDPGDGTGAQPFVSRSGTQITARIAHVYAESGTYTVTVRAQSRCSTPAPGGGTEPQYDNVVQRTVVVTP
jgi:hypothetical protein